MSTESQARELLARLQTAVSAHDHAALTDCFDGDYVVFGTVAANVDAASSSAYLAMVVEQQDTIRWEWDVVVPLVSSDAGVLVFAATGSVGMDDADGAPVGDRDPFRLTCVAVESDGEWRVRHFHGSVPDH